MRRALVCAGMSGCIFVSSSAEYGNDALASVFSKASFARARSALKSSRVIRRIEESKSGSPSSVTLLNWPDLFFKKRRRAQQSARVCLRKKVES